MKLLISQINDGQWQATIPQHHVTSTGLMKFAGKSQGGLDRVIMDVIKQAAQNYPGKTMLARKAMLDGLGGLRIVDERHFEAEIVMKEGWDKSE